MKSIKKKVINIRLPNVQGKYMLISNLETIENNNNNKLFNE